MPDALFLLPSIHRRRTDICLASMSSGVKERTVVIDNTRENRGVAASWNVGAQIVLGEQWDWLVVISAGIKFTWRGGVDFIDALHDADDSVPVLEADDGLGWHLIAFRRQTLDLVGFFDEQFYPAYCEDIEWSIRYQKITGNDSHAPDFVGPLWPKVPVDAKLVEVAHGIKRGGVVVDLEAQQRKLYAKWGEHEEFAHPYNRPELDLTYVGPPPDDTAPTLGREDRPAGSE